MSDLQNYNEEPQELFLRFLLKFIFSPKLINRNISNYKRIFKIKLHKYTVTLKAMRTKIGLKHQFPA